eukprot:TRINITY_DN13923_c0_g1_i3.p1 TRINITY_DN13923_c0_g1~~TRINITY_DN13923_c0_g1_i3.p1  ORF type:complete len:128 (+),score=42.50 TRINITY_DN13923_c0_g1_i3:385-768(+)
MPPGDALRHRPDRPFGFVLDTDYDPDKKRRPFFYFDGEDRSKMLHWVKHIDRAIRLLQLKADRDFAAEVDGSGALLDALDKVNETSKEMGAEARKQAELVKKLDEKVDGATEKIDQNNERLQVILEK